MRAQGLRVDLVALLDSGAPGSTYRQVTWSATFARDLLRDLPSWVLGGAQLNRQQWADLLRLKARLWRDRLAVATRRSNAGAPPRGSAFAGVVGDLLHFSPAQQHVAAVVERSLSRRCTRYLETRKAELPPGRFEANMRMTRAKYGRPRSLVEKMLR